MRPTLDDVRVVLRCMGREDLYPLVLHLSSGAPEYRGPDGRFGLLAIPKSVAVKKNLTSDKWKKQLEVGVQMISEVGLEAYLSPLSDRDRDFLDDYQRRALES